MPDWLTWFGIAFCVTQSGMFSGLNLALFSLNRLRLEISAEEGDHGAAKILELRRDSNYTLSTVLWGNVAVNCLLTMLSDSVMAGVGAFAFSTIGITVFGEIVPQAYFSRNAMKMGVRLLPLLRFYKVLLFPFAKPSAMLLDSWLGPEGVTYLRERDLRAVIEKHMMAKEADLARQEGIGVLNFLALDDLPIGHEGEVLDPRSILVLPVNVDLPLFPAFRASLDDDFVRAVTASGKKWVVLVDKADTPLLVLDSDAFVRGVFADGDAYDSYQACHRPLVIRDPDLPIGKVLSKLVVHAEHPEDDVIDKDLILLWAEERRVITGADLLGRLLRGIAARRDTGTGSSKRIAGAGGRRATIE